MNESEKQQMIAYRQRWAKMAEIERNEEAQRSIEERWMRMNFLYGFAKAMGLEFAKDESDEEVNRRWATLRKVM